MDIWVWVSCILKSALSHLPLLPRLPLMVATIILLHFTNFQPTYLGNEGNSDLNQYNKKNLIYPNFFLVGETILNILIFQELKFLDPIGLEKQKRLKKLHLQIEQNYQLREEKALFLQSRIVQELFHHFYPQPQEPRPEVQRLPVLGLHTLLLHAPLLLIKIFIFPTLFCTFW